MSDGVSSIIRNVQKAIYQFLDGINEIQESN